MKELYDDGAVDLGGWFKEQWEAAKSVEGAAAEVIIAAARTGSLSAEDAEMIRKTVLQRFMLEDYSSFGNMRVNPLVRSLLLDLEAAE